MSSGVPPVVRPSITVDGTVLSVDGSGPGGAFVTEVDVTLTTDRTSTARIVVMDDEATVLDGSTVRVGLPLVVAAVVGSATTELFSGRVTRLGVERDAGGTTTVVLEGRTDGHRLEAASASTTYLDTDPLAVIHTVAGRHGLSVETHGDTSQLPDLPYVAQSSTDAELLDQLTGERGWWWWTYADTLHVGRLEVEGPEVTLGSDDLLQFSVAYDGTGLPASVHVPQLPATHASATSAASSQVRTDSVTSTAVPDTSLVTDGVRGALDHLGGELWMADVPQADATQADHRATVEVTRRIDRGPRMEATVSLLPELPLGATVGLTGIGDALAGRYVATELRHHLGPDGDTTTIVSGRAPRASDGAAVPEGRAGSGPAGSGSWSTSGPVRGIVTEVEDPDGLGRVKVALPGLGPDVVSTWSHVAAPGAGEHRGLDLRPRIDDEVLVQFEHGDLGRAVVVGGLWTSGRAHADPREHGLQRRVLAGPDGSRLTFHEADDPDTAFDGSQVALPSEVETKGPGVSLVSVGEAGLHAAEVLRLFSAQKDIVISNGNATLTLAANGDVTLECATLTVETSGDTTVTVQGDTTAESAGLTLEARSDVAVSGSNVELTAMSGIALKSSSVKAGP